MYFWEYLLVGAAFIIAVWYLYRRIVVTRGCGCGCSASSCPGVQPKPGATKAEDAEDCAGCAATRDQN